MEQSSKEAGQFLIECDEVVAWYGRIIEELKIAMDDYAVVSWHEGRYVKLINKLKIYKEILVINKPVDRRVLAEIRDILNLTNGATRQLERDITTAPVRVSESFVSDLSSEISRFRVFVDNVLQQGNKEYENKLAILWQKKNGAISSHPILDEIVAGDFAPEEIALRRLDIKYANKYPRIGIISKLMNASSKLQLPRKSIRLQTFSLIPYKQGLTAVEAEEVLVNASIRYANKQGGTENDPDLSVPLLGLSEQCKQSGYGLLLVSAVALNPIRYDISPLLFTTADFNRDSGITPQSINRYSTISNVDKGVPPQNKMYPMGDTSASNWFILRTIDGTSFDVMKYRGELIFHSSFVEQYMQGQSKYTSLINDEFSLHVAKHIKAPVELKIEEHVPGAKIVIIVKRRLLDYIEKAINSNPPANMLQLFNVISNDEILDIISNTLFEYFERTGTRNPELFAYWLSKYTEIAAIFTHSIKSDRAKSSISAMKFREKEGADLTRMIVRGMDSIISDAVGKIFSEDSNIFIDLQLRMLMANLV